ncbi:hypothetical protein PHMEG_00028658 [Phytophthora megakarya]|uniref:Uncharacterized protein n=1 Tax=Phytophthora megakarya TaxID=4795 RepID=A0A225V2M7_9STRA|nr:hypothetical protein PHMEG_00028658 [Phytophthora megakarya]
MLPPFRRPAPPPPPATTASAPPRRSFGTLPRRSLLAPEVPELNENYAKGRDSDERKSDEKPDKKRDRRPRKKRNSRILSELRPVDGPESALPGVPAIDDEDSQVSEDPLNSGERAKEAFAAQRVRMNKKWWPDLGIYMYVGCCKRWRFVLTFVCIGRILIRCLASARHIDITRISEEIACWFYWLRLVRGNI